MLQTSNLKKHFNYQSSNIRLLLYEFTKPIHLNIFFRNLDYLALKCDLVKFDNNKWIYQPLLFCKDYYDEPYFAQVILLINNIGTFFDFVPNKFINDMILCPPADHIFDVMYLPNL